MLVRWLLDYEHHTLAVESPQGLRETVIATHGLLFYIKLFRRLHVPTHLLWNHVGAVHTQAKVYAMNILQDVMRYYGEEYGRAGKVPFPAAFLLLQINGKGELPLEEAPSKHSMSFGVAHRNTINTAGARPLVAQRLKPGFGPDIKE